MESAHGELGPSPEEAETKEVRMLREMMLRDRRQREEPQVSDEQLRSNDQLQQDEWRLFTETIYAFLVKRLDGDLFRSICIVKFQMVSVCLQNYFRVLMMTRTAKSFTRTGSSTWLQSQSRLMPLSYPSHRPPYFTLIAQWLDSVKLSFLCHMLDLIWAQQPGQEVVYEWVQWLQSSALSRLGFDDGLVIRQSDSTIGPVDVRAVGEIASPESVVHWLISYNEEQCHETFLSGLHDCMICFSEYAGVDFIKLPCGHYFCWRCMETYSSMHVKDGTVLKLLCPDDKCRGDVPPNLLKRLLGDAVFERWDRLILQKTLDSMADVTYCPRCETDCLEDEKNNALCSKCFFGFCTRCRERRHTGEKCVNLTPEEKLLSLQERQKVRRLSKDDIDRTIYLAREIFSIKEVLQFSVQCPHCGTAISRVSGCNHMICGNCRKAFCDGCGDLDCQGCSKTRHTDPKQLDVTSFLREEIDAGNETQKELMMQGSRQHPCPNCHQPNTKMGDNNHIFCWACQVHYCALCRKVVRRYTEHYGPRGCKQHTVDPQIPQTRTKKDDNSRSVQNT